MDLQAFTAVVDAWCASTGMERWEADADMNVEIDGVATALIYDAEHAPHALHVLCDMGHYAIPDIHRRMLELNGAIDTRRFSYFSLDPESGSVVLRITVFLSKDLDGGELPAAIHGAIAHARHQLNA